jgi:hypothetical protein
MKYLKLYEGFKSNKVSAVLSFINKKIKNDNTSVFLEKLKDIAKLHDFPLSSLSDEEIQYLPVNKALSIGKGEEAMNVSGVYCIKYWFSLDKGYLCNTGVGNKTMNYNEFNAYGSSRISNISGLDSSDLSKISREYNIGGIIVPTKLENLRTGDKVVMCCDNDFDGNLILGEIYLDNRGDDDAHYYFYQNENEGSAPSYSRGGIDLPQRYNMDSDNDYYYSWSLGTIRDESKDHCMMHKLIPDDKKLRFSDEDLDKINDKESVWDFNLPLNNNSNLVEWDYNREKVLNLINKNADFAIILFLDDIIIKNVDEPTSEIKIRRKSSKEGALALVKPEDIKKENVERYLNTIFKKLGIGVDKQELKNLNSVVLSSILSDYFIIDFYNYSGFYPVRRLSDFITYLYKLMSQVTVTDSKKLSNFNSVHDQFKNIKEVSLEKTKVYSNGIRVIKGENTKSAKKVYDVIERIIEIGKYLSNSIKNRDIETIEDLKSTQVKLSTLYELMQDEIFILSRAIRSVISYLGSTSDLLYYILEYSEEDYEKDIKRLDNLEKVVKDYF